MPSDPGDLTVCLNGVPNAQQYIPRVDLFEFPGGRDENIEWIHKRNDQTLYTEIKYVKKYREFFVEMDDSGFLDFSIGTYDNTRAWCSEPKTIETEIQRTFFNRNLKTPELLFEHFTNRSLKALNFFFFLFKRYRRKKVEESKRFLQNYDPLGRVFLRKVRRFFWSTKS